VIALASSLTSKAALLEVEIQTLHTIVVRRVIRTRKYYAKIMIGLTEDQDRGAIRTTSVKKIKNTLWM
jgi:hypothetical protein